MRISLKIQLILLTGSCFVGLSNIYAEFAHNQDMNQVDQIVHFKKSGSVSLETPSFDREVLRASVDVAKIHAMLEAKNKATIKRYDDFMNIPELPPCSSNKAKVDKSKFAANTVNKRFQLDMLVYDRDNFQDLQSAEVWPRTTVAYSAAEPDHLMRFGVWLGLKCLPTRIVHTERGLEIREGDAAWRLSKDELAGNKTLKQELKLLRKNKKK